MLRRAAPGSATRAVHLNLAALILFAIANLHPFLAFSFEGRGQVVVLASGVVRLWQEGMPFLAGIVLAAIDLLVSRRLLTAEERDGLQRLEITHDVLADLVVRSRDERRERERARRAEEALAADGPCAADIAFMTREVTGRSSKSNPTPELRGFETFCEGRPVEELPRIVTRICGVCPYSHHLASSKACDAVFGVKPPPAGEKLRRLVNSTAYCEEHILHFYFLGGPDFVMGPDADPAVRVIVHTGEGRAFQTGVDVTEIATDGVGMERYRASLERFIENVMPAFEGAR